MTDENKKLRKELDLWQKQIHERELNNALENLYSEFQRWQAKEIDPFELSQMIHSHYKGVAKELYLKYELASFAELNIASAISRGIMQLDELSPSLQKLVGPKIGLI